MDKQGLIYCVKCRSNTKTNNISYVKVQVGKDKLKSRYREVGICEICKKNKSRFAPNLNTEPIVEDIMEEPPKCIT